MQGLESRLSHESKSSYRPILNLNSLENVAKLKYWGATVTNRNLILEEIKRRLNSGNAFYHSVQNLLSSNLLSKDVNIKIYKRINLLAVLYGHET
jgi:hypothetical protein